MGMSHAAVPASAARTGWVRRQAIGSVVPSAARTPAGTGPIGCTTTTCRRHSAASASASHTSVRGGRAIVASVTQPGGAGISLRAEGGSARGAMT